MCLLLDEAEKPESGNRDIDLIMNRQTILILGLLLSFISTGCSRNSGDLGAGFEAGLYRTVVAFGDSIVEGYRQPEGWPEMLGRDLSVRYGNIRVINAGVSGDTAADGLSRIRRSVLDEEPDIVIISFGLNDMKNGRSVDEFTSDVVSMVDQITGSGAMPVLLTTTSLQKGAAMVSRFSPKPFNDSIREIALKKSVLLIDVYDRFKDYSTAEHLMDVAHPNLEGYRVLANIVREGLVGE